MNIWEYCRACRKQDKSDSLCLYCLRATLVRVDNIVKPDSFEPDEVKA